MSEEERIYPEVKNPEERIYLDLTPLQDHTNFRLTQITEVKKFLEDEIEFRRKIYNKYKKTFDPFTAISHVLNLTTAVSGSVGISSLAGVITAPIGLALGGISIGSAILSSFLSVGKKDILRKIENMKK